jgi:hypothetical protein
MIPYLSKNSSGKTHHDQDHQCDIKQKERIIAEILKGMARDPLHLMVMVQSWYISWCIQCYII